MKNIDFSLLQKHPVFAELSGEKEFELLHNYVKNVTVEPGDFLFKEGDEGHFLSFILSGQLDIIKESIHKKPVKIASLLPGKSVGEMSLIDKISRSATVKASVATQLIELSKENFDQLLETHPTLGIKLLRGIARSMSLNLRRASNRLADCLPPII